MGSGGGASSGLGLGNLERPSSSGAARASLPCARYQRLRSVFRALPHALIARIAALNCLVGVCLARTVRRRVATLCTPRPYFAQSRCMPACQKPWGPSSYRAPATPTPSIPPLHTPAVVYLSWKHSTIHFGNARVVLAPVDVQQPVPHERLRKRPASSESWEPRAATVFLPHVPDSFLLLPPSLREPQPEGCLADHVNDWVDGLDPSAFDCRYAGGWASVAAVGTHRYRAEGLALWVCEGGMYVAWVGAQT